MTWTLMIDDERFPSDEGVVLVRTCQEAIRECIDRGLPTHLLLDHDLGMYWDHWDTESESYVKLTVIEFVVWLRDTLQILHHHVDFCPVKTYHIHSQNPVGAENIRNIFEYDIPHLTGWIIEEI